MDDRYTIDTPENIEFAYDIAGIGSRFLAALIDTILIIIGQAIVVFALMSALSLSSRNSLLVAVAVLMSFVLLWGYYILLELVWNGQSIGKRAIGLRVVREGGRPITFINSAIRNLIRIVDFMPLFYGIGVIVMFIDPRARRLGDLAGGTLVVKERAGITLESLTTSTAADLPAPDQPARQPTLPNIQLLTDRDYNLIQEFLRRRADLGREARARLAFQIASGIRVRLGLPQEGDAERFLQYVAAEYQLLKRQESSLG